MNIYTSNENILSHPPDSHTDGKKLTTHLLSVSDNCKRLSVDTNLKGNKDISYKSLTKDIALLHDIGKFTQDFQRYIRDEDYREMYKRHGFIGAAITGIVLSKKYTPYAGLIGYITVRRHHGQLNKKIHHEIKEFTHNKSSSKSELHILSEQLDNIKKYAYPLANTIINKVDKNQTFNEIITDIHNKNIIPEFSNIPSKTLYEDIFTMWTTLITGDKIDAAGLDSHYFDVEKPLSTKQIDRKISSLQSESIEDNLNEPIKSHESLSKLNKLREKSRQESIEWAKSIDVEQKESKIYNLSLPTGFGKTFAGLSAGLTLAQRKNGNLIYTLPFTSIIDQVDDEIQKTFDINSGDSEYTIHHYLADTKTHIKDTQKGRREEMLLAKTWNSQITLTTFVQLFESLTVPKNIQGVKIPALKNSVIILDEPQAISYDWWSLIPYLMNYLIRTYNVTIISMTATQPTLFKSSNDIQSVEEILPTNVPYINYLESNPRVKYKIDNSTQDFLKNGSDSSPKSHRKLAKNILSNDDFSSILSICNTIKSAETLTKKLNENSNLVNINAGVLSSNPIDFLTSKQSIIHITTRITPKHRKKLINIIKERIDLDLPTIVVSTQLIEAGVDVSFNKVYRDIAPLTSIVQAAGRCNRNNTVDTGEINIIRLEPPQDSEHTPSSMVYNRGLKLLNATRKTLDASKKSYSEVDFINIIQNFYDNIPNAGASEYKEYIYGYNTPKLSDISLIDSKNKMDIAVLPEDKVNKYLKNINKLHKSEKRYLEYELQKNSELDMISYPLPYEETDKETILENTIYCDNAEMYILKDTNALYDSQYGIKLDSANNNNQFIF